MSLRANICGFSLSELEVKFGCGDRALVGALHAELEQHPIFRSRERQRETATILERAVMTGVPFPELAVEGEAHVAAANLLARHGQNLVHVDASFYRAAAFAELHREFPEALAGTAIDVFVQGRPMLGRRISTGWSFYGFLDTDQVDGLCAAVRVVRSTIPPPPPPVPPDDDDQSKRSLAEASAVRDVGDFFSFLDRLEARGRARGAIDLASAFRAYESIQSTCADVQAIGAGPRMKAIQRAQMEICRRRDPHSGTRMFVNDLESWLTTIADAKRQLWFLAY